MIKAILDRHDILPKQVLIQVLVVEISLNDLIKFGVEFSMTGGSGNVETLGGTNYKNLNPRSDNEYGGRFNIFNPKNPNENTAMFRPCPELPMSRFCPARRYWWYLTRRRTSRSATRCRS